MARKNSTKKAAQAPSTPVVTVVSAPAQDAPVVTVVNAPAPAETTAITPAQVAANAVAPAKAPRYVTRANFNLQQTVATVVPNPKRAGCAAHTAFSFYEVGATLAACMENSAKAGHKGKFALLTANVAWDLAHGFITLNAVATAPVAAETK
jgi:hypothetical protein